MNMAEKVVLPKWKIGVEIETNIEIYDICELCGYCRVCEDCPQCEYCRDWGNYCDDCSIEDMILYAKSHGYENAKPENICRICGENDFWRDTICSTCSPCDYCEYTYNPDYCPLDTYEILKEYYPSEYLKDIYNDGSCGLEFTTKPLTNLSELRKALKEIVEEIGKDNIDTYYYCGGHTNISWETDFDNWYNYRDIIVHNTTYFSDLLSYMFCDKDTYRRYTYKTFTWNYADSHDKYKAIHLKDYAVEFRFPDSPKDVDNHILLTSVLLSLTFLKQKIDYTINDLHKTEKIYKKINRDNEKLNSEDKRYLKEKFNLLLKLIKPYLMELSKQLNVDLVKALYWRFNNPKYEEKENSEYINLNNFPLTKKPFKAIFEHVQLSLTQFGICLA